ncbi:hypothetical protein [Streptomyces sp. NPDC054887]
MDDGPTDTRGGDNPLDMAKAVAAEKWREEIIETLTPILSRAAQVTAKDAADALGSTVAGASAGIGAAVLSATSVAAETIHTFHDYLIRMLNAEQKAGAGLDYRSNGTT